MEPLERAINIAVTAHENQVEKNGDPYILHPLRLMGRCTREQEKIAAVLQDVVEDTSVTLEDLKEAGFEKEIIDAVDCLTKREDETYDDFIKRAAFDPIARKVKIFDIEDNLNTPRIPELTDKDLDRIRKYHSSYRYLEHIDEITKTITVGEFLEEKKFGRLCVRIFLIPKVVPFQSDILRSGPAVIHFIGWCSYSEQVPAEYYEPVREALLNKDTAALYNMNRDWAPYYCPECGVNYHESNWHSRYLNDSYSVLEGTCPQGHKRILED
jgi:hypothetical protein